MPEVGGNADAGAGAGAGDIVRLGEGALYSQAVVRGDTVHLAGQVDPAASATFGEQVSGALASVDQWLAAAGTDRTRILAVTIYVTDVERLQEMNAIWTTWLDGTPPPARATVQAQLVDPRCLIELSVVAAR